MSIWKGLHITSIKGMEYYILPDNENVIPPDPAKQNSRMIFDDAVCEKTK